MNKYILKMFFRIALYRKALNVKEARIIGDDNLFPVCPRCGCTMNREYQSFCDRCGQKLKWKDFSKVKIVEAET